MRHIIGANFLQIAVEAWRCHKDQADLLFPAELHNSLDIFQRIGHVAVHVLRHIPEVVPPGDLLRMKHCVRPDEAPACVILLIHSHRRIASVLLRPFFLHDAPDIGRLPKLLPVPPKGQEAVRILVRLGGRQQKFQLVRRQAHIIGNDIRLHQIPVLFVDKQEFVMHIQINSLQIVVAGRLPEKIIGSVIILGGGSQVKRRFAGELCKKLRVVGPEAVGAPQEQGVDLFSFVRGFVKLVQSQPRIAGGVVHQQVIAGLYQKPQQNCHSQSHGAEPQRPMPGKPPSFRLFSFHRTNLPS